MDNGGIPVDWRPTPPPDIGSIRWKKDVIERSVGRTHSVNKAFLCNGVGLFCCERTNSGWNYFWIDEDNYTVLPKIDWIKMMEQAIKSGYYPEDKIK